jgi:hypothetical protein
VEAGGAGDRMFPIVCPEPSADPGWRILDPWELLHVGAELTVETEAPFPEQPRQLSPALTSTPRPNPDNIRTNHRGPEVIGILRYPTVEVTGTALSPTARRRLCTQLVPSS